MRLPQTSVPHAACSGVAGRPQDGALGVGIASVLRTAAAAALILGGTLSPLPSTAAYVTDGAAIGKCLLSSCQLPLARCITDPICLTNLACIQTCTGKPDESTCQIKCGDEFTNGVVEQFTKCAVSEKGCVPQRPDDGTWPVPPKAALVEKFTTEALQGPWYISAGLNKAFDTCGAQGPNPTPNPYPNPIPQAHPQFPLQAHPHPLPTLILLGERRAAAHAERLGHHCCHHCCRI